MAWYRSSLSPSSSATKGAWVPLKALQPPTSPPAPLGPIAGRWDVCTKDLRACLASWVCQSRLMMLFIHRGPASRMLWSTPSRSVKVRKFGEHQPRRERTFRIAPTGPLTWPHVLGGLGVAAHHRRSIGKEGAPWRPLAAAHARSIYVAKGAVPGAHVGSPCKRRARVLDLPLPAEHLACNHCL